MIVYELPSFSGKKRDAYSLDNLQLKDRISVAISKEIFCRDNVDIRKNYFGESDLNAIPYLDEKEQITALKYLNNSNQFY